jgi:hypothetical protein
VRCVNLSRAGFYRWRLPRQATPVEMEVRDEMQKVALEGPAYGYRRITRELQPRGFEINHQRVLRMMRRTICDACGGVCSRSRLTRDTTCRSIRTWPAK